MHEMHQLTCFPKIRHRTKLHLQPPPIIVSSIHHIQRIRCLLLITKFRIHMSYHMIPQIVTHMQCLKHTKFRQLFKKIFKETQEILCRLRFIDRNGIRALSLECGLQFRLACRMAVGMLDEYSLGECRTVMHSGASVSVTTGADFEVEGTVDLVLFGAVDAC